jgi:hypothetical protein
MSLGNKPDANSWDMFDTLLGRKCYFPQGIFDIVAVKTDINNFARFRKEAEQSTHSTYDAIYVELADRAGHEFPSGKFRNLLGNTKLRIEDIKEIEFETELEQAFR